MQLKLDLETSRVKGVVFHPTRPWVLYSTHTGTVHLHDYEIGVELFCFNVTTNNKPVRCVAFHPTQPLFACGTDDFDVVVYNWQRKIKLFTLTGHTDYVRSVEFHSKFPLLISSSDDSTARIWNWQSRCCVAILEEHTYFVMSARFNPEKPLIATASLDDCVRVFNVNALFNSSMSTDVDASFISMDDTAILSSELEEHPEGATCVAWDKTGNRLISCGEDSEIKIYLVVNDEASLMTTIPVHNGPVTAVAVHYPTSNFVSVSEDSTVRLFDSSTNQQIFKYEISMSRFWCVACHSRDSLIAAGHDHGLIILKFAKEKPPYDIQGNSVLYVQNHELHVVDVITKETEKPIAVKNGIKCVSWNNSRNLALVSYIDNTKGQDVTNIVDMQSRNPITPSEGGSAIWLSRSSFATLSFSKDKLLIKEIGANLTGSVRSVSIPYCNNIFPATQQRIFISTRTSIILYDVIRSQVVSEVTFSNAKSISFDEKKENICCRNSSSILIAKSDLTQSFTYTELGKIKSCCFCNSIVLYTTKTHLKYIVKSASGVVCSLPRVLYLIKANNETAWFMTRDGDLFTRQIDLSEVKLKSALLASQNEDIARRIVRENPPIGDSIMQFAANNNRYDIAASLAKDPKTKFEMCLKSGDFKSASETADELNDPKYYKTLAQKLIDAGQFSKAESALKKAKDNEMLAFLYLISGEGQKLSKLAKQTGSIEHLLWTNDDAAIAKCLQKVAPSIEYETESNSMKVELGIPVLQDWPTLNTTSTVFSSVTDHDNLINIDDEDIAGWADDDVLEAFISEGNDILDENEDDNEGWKFDLDINDDVLNEEVAKVSTFTPPARGQSMHDTWSSNSSNAGVLAASGHFVEALSSLQSQVCLKVADPLRDLFVECYLSSNCCVPTHVQSITLTAPLSVNQRNQVYPSLSSQLPIVDELTKLALSYFSRGKFADCHSTCLSIMQRIMIASCTTREEEQKLRGILETARNYCLAVNLEMTRKNEASSSNSQVQDPIARQVELATYLTYLKLVPSHVRLVLQSAMRVTSKGENFGTCKTICQRLIDTAPPEKIAKQAQQMLAICNQKQNANKHKIDFDERNPFVVCAMSMKPIYRGKQSIQCPFCGANYFTQFKGKVCSVCEMCEIGGQAEGIKLMRFGK